MKRDLNKILSDIANGTCPSCLLLFGDDFQVREARKKIVDCLVPESHRDFNFERFDGRNVPWVQIQASLMTPPFCPGKKVVWVENAPYFLSREQKGEVGQKILQLWSEGRKEDAGRLFLDFLTVEGWSDEQWSRLDAGSFVAPVIELLDLDEHEGQEFVASLLAYCKGQDMRLGQNRGPDAHGLAEIIEVGLPPWDLLLLTAPQVDRRTRLYKKFEEKGAVLHLGFERDRSGKLSRESLLEFVNQRLMQAGKKIAPQARELLLLRTCDELGVLQQEIEKLLLYVGDQSSIGVEDIAAIVVDEGAGWIFDLTRAVAARDAVAGLSELARLVAQGDHPLKLLATLASEVRKLLTARQLMEGKLRGCWKRGMTYAQFQQTVANQGTGLLTRNPYADFMCFQRADNFSLTELLVHLRHIHDTDLRLKSSGAQARLVMERLILNMCRGAPTGVNPAGQAATS